MKKLLLLAGMAMFVVACSSDSKRTTSSADGTVGSYRTASTDKTSKYQIIDQEFDNMLAPETDYETLTDYELQACGASYLPPEPELKNVQPKTEVVVLKEEDLNVDESRKKKVVKNKNIYYMDGPAPKKVSSTSTTTVTSSSSSSSSSTVNGATTYNSNASTSTTTY